MEKTIYKQNSVKPIQNVHIKQISEKYELELNEKEVEEYNKLAIEYLDVWNYVYQYRIPTKISQYKRSTIENYLESDNSLYFKCSIMGKEGGKLSGKKIIVKDTVQIAGVPLMNGSHVLEGWSPVEDATIIKRLLNHGVHIVGKSSCEDLCFSGSSITNVKGPVENIKFKGCNAGGSSSGSATAILLGLCDFSIAGDQGGSIRIPAAFNGLTSLKPTFGLIPYSGILGLEYTVDHVGPIAKNVTDIAIFLDCCAGPDDRDQRYFTYLKHSQFSSDNCDLTDDEIIAHNLEETNSQIIKSSKSKSEFEKSIKYCINRIKVDYSKAVTVCKEVIPELKVAFLKEGWDSVFSDLKDKRLESKQHLSFQMKEKYGIDIEEISIPEHTYASTVIFINFVEGYFDAIRNNFVGKNNFNKESFELAKMFFLGERCWKDLSHSNKLFIVIGDYIKEKYGSRFYAKAQEIRSDILKAYFEVFKKYDLLIMPTLSGLPQKLPSKDITLEEYFFTCFGSVCSNTSAYNFTGYPALTLNYNKKEELCPIMVVGRHFEDHRVLQFSKLIEDL